LESIRLEPGDDEIYFRRFQPNQILLHITVIVTFLTLVFTEMCLKFSGNPYFLSAAMLFGGPGF
jgi:hypothetical protein